jgi:hypothetical protein
MQRASFAVDFSSLLNPQSGLEQQQEAARQKLAILSRQQQEESEMETVSVMPLPIGGQSHGEQRPISPARTNVLFATKHSTVLSIRRDTFEHIPVRSLTLAN